MHLMRTLAAAALLVSAAGCSDVLEVTNPNDPDRERILARPSDVEGLASSQFQQIISATLGSIARVQTGMMTASFENASGLANNGLGPRSGIPRQPDRKSTRLNSSHVKISYAVFCLKKKNKNKK